MANDLIKRAKEWACDPYDKAIIDELVAAYSEQKARADQAEYTLEWTNDAWESMTLMYRREQNARLAAEAENKGLREDNAKHERTIARQHKQASTSRSFWLRAARAALNGDMRELRNRVDLADAPPVDVVLSLAAKEAGE